MRKDSMTQHFFEYGQNLGVKDRHSGKGANLLLNGDLPGARMHLAVSIAEHQNSDPQLYELFRGATETERRQYSAEFMEGYQHGFRDPKR